MSIRVLGASGLEPGGPGIESSHALGAWNALPLPGRPRGVVAVGNPTPPAPRWRALEYWAMEELEGLGKAL